jgi:predicted GNAT superfamily acetyltransferase
MSEITGKKIAEYLARQKDAISRGLYTPEMVAELDPDVVAKTLNGLVTRVNMNIDVENRIRARRFATTLLLVGAVVGAALTSATFWVLFSPLKDIAAAVRESHR